MQVCPAPVRTFTAPASTELAPYRRVKYDATNGLAYAGPHEAEIGTMNRRHVVTGVGKSAVAGVLLRNAEGTHKMIAVEAIGHMDWVYGADAGKVGATENANPIGINVGAAATADGDEVEVLRMPMPGVRGPAGDAETPGVHIWDDFIGDWPAAGSALTNAWTKVETNGLGVVSLDASPGVLDFAFDAVAEAATSALYYAAEPILVTGDPVFVTRARIDDIGDDAALDINFGLASGTHATDADAIVTRAFFHLDGNNLSLLCVTDDGTTDSGIIDTGVDLTADVWYDFKIDLSDLTSVKFYYRADSASQWTRLLPSTTFSMAAATGQVTPLFHVEKTSNDTTASVEFDFVDVKAAR